MGMGFREKVFSRMNLLPFSSASVPVVVIDCYPAGRDLVQVGQADFRVSHFNARLIPQCVTNTPQ